MTTTDIHRTIEAVWRIESAKLIAALARMVHDVGTSEELAQDALVAALASCHQTGVPDNPAAWLMTTAHRRTLDPHRPHNLPTKTHTDITHVTQTRRKTNDQRNNH